MKSYLKAQIISFSLPVVVLVVIPAIILFCMGGFRLGWGLGLIYDVIIVAIGIIFLATGLYFLISTILLFIRLGKGTLAPWSPTSKMVISGPYRYVRNPMISGVLMAILAESIITGSIWILEWSVLFFIVNHFYFIFSEEPGLVKRFGEEYVRYSKNVPRWIPRFTPWKNE
jgi:protein-S-isoprenylcysteine O-methyltransferase Ste14